MRTLVVALILLAGCSTPAEPPPWHGKDTNEEGWQPVQLGRCGGYELDYQLQEGDVLEWDWFVDERLPVQWDMHTHANDPTAMQTRTSEQYEGNFTVRTPGMYSLLWVNQNEEIITVWMKVQAGGFPSAGTLPDSYCFT